MCRVRAATVRRCAGECPVACCRSGGTDSNGTSSKWITELSPLRYLSVIAMCRLRPWRTRHLAGHLQRLQNLRLGVNSPYTSRSEGHLQSANSNYVVIPSRIATRSHLLPAVRRRTFLPVCAVHALYRRSAPEIEARQSMKSLDKRIALTRRSSVVPAPLGKRAAVCSCYPIQVALVRAKGSPCARFVIPLLVPVLAMLDGKLHSFGVAWQVSDRTAAVLTVCG